VRAALRQSVNRLARDKFHFCAALAGQARQLLGFVIIAGAVNVNLAQTSRLPE
jgi:hypothetical protein